MTDSNLNRGWSGRKLSGELLLALDMANVTLLDPPS